MATHKKRKRKQYICFSCVRKLTKFISLIKLSDLLMPLLRDFLKLYKFHFPAQFLTCTEVLKIAKDYIKIKLLISILKNMVSNSL